MAKVTSSNKNRTRKNQSTTKDTRLRYQSIFGVIVTALGILTLVSLCAELRGPVGAAGAAGMRVAYGLKFIAGRWAYLIPITISCMGIDLALGHDTQVILPRLLGSTFIILSALGIAGSGIIGTAILDWLEWACGSLGSKIVLWFIAIAGLSLLLDMSIPVLFKESVRILVLGFQLLTNFFIRDLEILNIIAQKVLLPF